MPATRCENLRELIRSLVRELGILEKTDASCCGITLPQCHAIVEIGRRKTCSLVELASLLGVDKSTMSRTINALVETGLVQRDLDEQNRRYVVIQLSEQGRTIYQDIEERMAGYYETVLASIPEEDQAQVIEGLRLLTEAVKKNRCCR